MSENRISIWFFIGALLTIYGVIILGANVYDLFHPLTENNIILGNLHAGVWWGALLLVIGLVYSILFRPGKAK